jgi:glycerophosphoryl diester phosphodiesterase
MARARFYLLALLLLAGAVLAAGAAMHDEVRAEYRPAPPGLHLIAHAGGGLPQGTYTNAVEAFDLAHANGFRLFETDFARTRDGRIVLIHDWDATYARLFTGLPLGIAVPALRLSGWRPGHAGFMASRMRGGLTPMDLEALLDWMRRHPDARVVTDVKDDNLAVLAAIAAAAPELRGAFVPQIYAPDELDPVRRLGFRNVILTLYRSALTDDEVIAFARGAALWAVTMPHDRTRAGRLVERLSEAGIRVAVHTLNAPEDAEALRRRGVSLLYTDYLLPRAE